MPSVLARCENCRGKLKIWPKKLSFPFTCDNFACTKPALGAGALRFNCFVCDFDLCELCVGIQPVNEKKGCQRWQTHRNSGELYQKENTVHFSHLNNAESAYPDPLVRGKTPLVVINNELRTYNEYENPFNARVQEDTINQSSTSGRGSEKGLNPGVFCPDIHRSYESLPMSSLGRPMAFAQGRGRSRSELKLNNFGRQQDEYL